MVVKLPNTTKGHVTSQNPPRRWKWPQKVFWMIHSRALTPLLMATVQNGGATLTVGCGGTRGVGNAWKVTDIWTGAKKSHSRLDAEGFCKPSSSEELSHFLLPPLASHWLSTIFIDLLLPGNLVSLSLPSLSLPVRSKKKTLFSGGAILLSQPFWWVRSMVTKFRKRKKGLPDKIWISDKEWIFKIQVYLVQYLGHNPLTLSVVYLKVKSESEVA